MMGAPNVVINKNTIGRRGYVEALVEWTAQDADDLEAVTLLDPALDASGKYGTTRFKVLDAQYDSDDGTEVKVEYDSLPASDALIFAIAGGVTQGSRNFRNSLQGARVDPDRDMPSKIVLTTTGAVPGTALYLTMNYQESGVRPN